MTRLSPGITNASSINTAELVFQDRVKCAKESVGISELIGWFANFPGASLELLLEGGQLLWLSYPTPFLLMNFAAAGVTNQEIVSARLALQPDGPGRLAPSGSNTHHVSDKQAVGGLFAPFGTHLTDATLQLTSGDSTQVRIYRHRGVLRVFWF